MGKRWAAAMVMVILFSIFLSAWCAETMAQQRPAIRFGYNKGATAPALLVGKNKGIFDGKGFEVRWLTFGGPPMVIEAIAAGSLDAGVVVDPTYVVARERGVKVSAVALLAGPEQPSSSYFVLKDSGINRIEDLRGKSCGVNNYGGNFDLFLRYMLDKHGLVPMKDVKILEMPIPTVFSALLAKKIDCGVVPPLFAQMGLEQYSDKMRILFDYYDLDINKDGWNTMIMVMSQDLIGKRRETARAFLKAYLEAIKYTNEDQDRAIQVWSQEEKMPAVAKMKKIPFLPPNGKINVKGMENTIMLLKRFGFTKTEPRAETVIDHTLLDEVLEGK